MTLSHDHLAHLARALEADQHRTGRWTSPARLLGLPPVSALALDTALAAGTVPWVRLGEGSAYHLLDTVAIDPERVVALGLVVHGWAFPPDQPDTWAGRPSHHPGRIRVRTATVLAADGSRCSAIRLQDRADVLVDAGGEGMVLRAMVLAWARARRPGDAALASPAQAPQPAHCRRDHRS